MLQAQHSIVRPDAILKTVKKHYPSIGAHDCELLALGCNDNYRVMGKRRDYALRLYRYDWWPAQDVDEELRFLEAMRRKQLNVVKPVRTSRQQRYIKVNTVEGIRYGALFEFIPGRPLGHNFGKRNVNMHNLGEMVGRVHTIADHLKQPIQRWCMSFENIVVPFLRDAPLVLGHREKDLTYLNQLAAQLQEVIESQPANSLNYGLCHGDLHVWNVMLQPDNAVAIFDFDWCGNSWRGYELATIRWSLPRDVKGDAPWKAFLRGYTRERKLSRPEQKLLPWFVVLRQFEFLNFQLSMRRHIGTAWLNDNYYDHQINFFKSWIKQHLL